MAIGQVLEDHRGAATHAEGALLRPSLQRRLDEAGAGRLTCLVAGAGFGKTTLLQQWRARQATAWHSVRTEDRDGEHLARSLLDALGVAPDGRAALTAALDPATWLDGSPFAALVIDDVDLLVGSPGALDILVAFCGRTPPHLRLVLSSRVELPHGADHGRGRYQVSEIGPATLAFTAQETTQLVCGLVPGDDAEALAGGVHELTHGWPAAVRLAVDALRDVTPARRREALAHLGEAGDGMFASLANEVLAGDGPEIRTLLAGLAVLDRFTTEQAASVLGPEVRGVLARLERRGLVSAASRGRRRWSALNPVVRAHLRRAAAVPPDEAQAIRTRAAEWLLHAGEGVDALRVLVASGDGRRTRQFLERHGDRLLSVASADVVLDAVRLVGDRSTAVRLLEGDAHQLRGTWEDALAAYRAALVPGAPVPSGLAWRLGLIHHLRGDLDAALAAYGQGTVDDGEPADGALLLAWTATAHWRRGDLAGCRVLMERASTMAHLSGAPRALAAAATVQALVAATDGDRAGNDAHYVRALECARQAGDTLQIIRIGVNRGSRLVEEGFHEEAIAELEEAVTLGQSTGFALLGAVALANRGEAALCLGRLDEARADLDESRRITQRLGAGLAAYPLVQLGELHRCRGDLHQARAWFEEAVTISRRSGDLAALVPALAGLAVVRTVDDPDEGRRLAEEAVAFGPVLGHVAALLASGWAALAQMDPAVAVERARQAAALARTRRDRSGLAEALELEADGRVARGETVVDLLTEAHAIWVAVGNPLAQARVELGLARNGGGGPDRARQAERTFLRMGARRHAQQAADVVQDLEHRARPPIAIRTLGGFGVVSGGRPVAPTAWQSRQARDLLKMLVARRGGPLHREWVLDAFWPDEPPERAAPRLSVVLSTLRTVLDPGHAFDPVAADRETISLVADRVDIDVLSFLDTAGRGLRLLAAGDATLGADALVAAEGAYAGDFLPDDPFADWAAPLREQARNACLEVTAALAALALGAGDPNAAIRYQLRLLEHDPYDERAHLGLVASARAAGRHGDAGRYHRQYCARMAELGVAPEPLAAPSAGPR